jgi:hypothetical protein
MRIAIIGSNSPMIPHTILRTTQPFDSTDRILRASAPAEALPLPARYRACEASAHGGRVNELHP